MIYSCFAGIGKTTLAGHSDYVDLESSDYQWEWDEESQALPVEERKGLDTKVKNEEFPQNYIDAIRKHHDEGRHVLISAQPEVLTALVEADLPFTTVAPNASLKDEYIARYQARGNTEEFIVSMTDNFDVFSKSMLANVDAVMRIEITASDYYLSDVLGVELHETLEETKD